MRYYSDRLQIFFETNAKPSQVKFWLPYINIIAGHSMAGGVEKTGKEKTDWAMYELNGFVLDISLFSLRFAVYLYPFKKYV